MKHTYLKLIGLVLLFVLSHTAFAYDIAVKNEDGVTIYYNYYNEGTELEVTSGSYKNSVNIPETVTYMNRTRKVTSIGTKAFYNCSGLTSVTIPSSVTSIGNSAFYGCSRLTSVTIPSSVTSIGGYAFYGCFRLTSVTIPSSVTSIGSSAFAGCSGLTSVTIPSSVTSIGSQAFHDCDGLTSVNIPSSVTSIGNDAFSDCDGLTSVNIPSSVTSIGWSAFQGCSGLTSVTISEGVTSIGDYAFQYCSGLTSVTIPSSVTSIGSYAFNSDNLATVVSLIENPFVIKDNTFSQNTFMNASLMIPTGTKDKYKTTGGWKKFLFIEEQDPSQLLGIEAVNQDTPQESSVTSRYSVSGKQITTPQRGINIIRMSDGTTRKEVVR